MRTSCCAYFPQLGIELSGQDVTFVRLLRNLYDFKQATRTCCNRLITPSLDDTMRRLGCERRLADVCRLYDRGGACLREVFPVHVDDIFAVGRKDRSGQLCEGLNRLPPTNILGELRWDSGCRVARDCLVGCLFGSRCSMRTER